MNDFSSLGRSRLKINSIPALITCLVLVYLVASGARLLRAQSPAGVGASDSALLADFRHVEVASVSDALEQLTGKRMYMSHRMHPIFTTKFAGFAGTVQVRKDEGNTNP